MYAARFMWPREPSADFIYVCLFVSALFCQSGEKEANPLLATQASPGMGKSSLIDAICSLTEAQVRELSPADSTPEFHKAMSSSLGLTIDYNGIQSPLEIDVKHPVTGLAIRILHSYVRAR